MAEQNEQNQQNQQQEQNQQNQSEKTFTQAEVDAIITRRLAKEKKGMPDEAELTAFRAWKDSQQTEQQRMNTITQERDTAKSDLAAAQAKIEQYERERLMLSKGVAAEDVDYYVFKAAKLVSDSKTFEQAADEVIKTRQTQNSSRLVVNLGGSLQGGTGEKTSNDVMNALIRGARK